MMQIIFDLSVRFATTLIVIVGTLGVIALLLAAGWKLIDYLFRSTKSVALIIEYARNRKAFRRWHKENNNRVFTPKIKERDSE